VSRVVVIGAGLAGLTAALHLERRGVEVTILEAADDVGGRVRTDVVDGFLLDRGFQVLLSAYPEAQVELRYAELSLRPFVSGALVRADGRFSRVTDPWRDRRGLLVSALSPVGSAVDKVRAGRWRWRLARGGLDNVFVGDEQTAAAALRAEGFSERMIDRFYRPFLRGVLLDADLETSSRMMAFVLRMFAAGEAVLPAAGMAAIPHQLAAQVVGEVRLNTPAVTVSPAVAVDEPAAVTLATGERLTADALVVATDGTAAARFVGAVPAPVWRAVTCLSFAASRPPIDEPILVLNGEGFGLVNNLAVPSLVQPSYAPAGAALVSASILGLPVASDAQIEAAARQQLRVWFGRQVDDWQLLRVHRVAQALPALPHLEFPLRPAATAPGLFVAGDHWTNPSMNGALTSGRRAAAEVVRVLGL
jgi:phytoene dehydrogenase-like protein